MKNNRLIRILLILGLLVGITFAIVYRDRFDAAALEAWINDAGALAPLAFMLIYALATVLFLPGSVITLAGGALFGPVLGTLYNLTGATLGAALAFLISRYLASDWIADKAGGRVKQLINGVEGEGWRFVAFVRLVPLFPFNLLNYGFGLTSVPFWTYLFWSWLCMLPGTLLYVVGADALFGGLSQGRIPWFLLGAAAVVMVILVFLVRYARSQLKKKETSD